VSLFSSIGKFFFGGSKKQGSTSSSGTTTSTPWSIAVPQIQDYLNATSHLYNGGGAPLFSPLEQKGYDELNNVYNGSAGVLDPAVAENNKTLSGAYLDPSSNPYLKGIADRLAGVAGSTSIGQFGSGRTDSGLSSYYAGKGAADAAGQVYYQNYNDERSRMGSAVAEAPALNTARYVGPQAIISAGQNESARPYDINTQYGTTLRNIASLGQTTNATGSTSTYGQSPGLIGGIINSFTNKLFPGVAPY